jgi:hypothetical protein
MAMRAAMILMSWISMLAVGSADALRCGTQIVAEGDRNPSVRVTRHLHGEKWAFDALSNLSI